MNPQSDKSQSVVSALVPQDIDYQATHWLAVLDGDEPSAENIAAFHKWKNEDEAHRKAFEKVLELWGKANILTRLESPSAEQRAFNGFSFIRPVSAAAFTFVLLVAVLLVQPWGESGAQVYVTAIGEQQVIELPDGSEVMLNTDSQVTVQTAAPPEY